MGKKLTKYECEAAVEKMYEKTDWQDRIDNAKKAFSEEYKKLYNLGKEQDDLERAARQWKSDTVKALYKLNSRTRIQEAFPEALPYLCFDIPQNCAIQVYNYDKLRTCFKKD